MEKGRPGLPAMMDDLLPMEAAGLYLRNGEDVEIGGLRVVGHTGGTIDADAASSWIRRKK
jgi:hypothetical protein